MDSPGGVVTFNTNGNFNVLGDANEFWTFNGTGNATTTTHVEVGKIIL
jgi:hypothetical protein